MWECNQAVYQRESVYKTQLSGTIMSISATVLNPINWSLLLCMFHGFIHSSLHLLEDIITIFVY